MADEQNIQDPTVAPEETPATTDVESQPADGTEAPASDPLADTDPSSTAPEGTEEATTSSEASDVAAPGVIGEAEFAEAPPAEEAPTEAENPTMVPGTEGQAAEPTDGSSTSTDAPADANSSITPTSDVDQGNGPAVVPTHAQQDPEAVADLPENTPAPLDAAVGGALPAAEETTEKADAPAPEKADADSSKEDKGAPGDPGVGPTHAGTDTPKFLISNPCDPVTGKALSDVGQGGGLPQIGGGSVPPEAPGGAVSPSVAAAHGYGADDSEEDSSESEDGFTDLADDSSDPEDDSEEQGVDFKEALQELNSLAELFMEKLAELNSL